MASAHPVWRWCLGMIFLVSLGLMLGSAQAKNAYLVTYGPGEEVWEWFGHNAIWLQDTDQGLDHAFSFGYFDMDADGFYRRFLSGEMRYFGSSVPIEREFGFYRQRNRSIRVQELNFSEEQFDRLQLLLTQAIYPYPQYYDYDYYRANCSTWLRDLLDEATDGALSGALQTSPAEQSLRQHTATQTRHHPLAYLGLMALLGPAVDQPITQWDEAFLPSVLADQVTEIDLPIGPLVVSDAMDHDAPSPSMDGVLVAGPGSLMVWGFFIAGLILMPTFIRSRLAWVPMGMTIVTLSVAGFIILGMDVLTAHEVVGGNQMLIVLHPLWLGLLPIGPTSGRRIAWVVCASLFILGVSAWMAGLLVPQDGLVLWLLAPMIAALLVLTQRVLWPAQSTAPARADA